MKKIEANQQSYQQMKLESRALEESGLPGGRAKTAGFWRGTKATLGKMLMLAVLAMAPVIVRAADEPAAAATNAAAAVAAAGTNAMAMAATTNAPAPAQQPDSVAYPPGANAGNETDLTWPIPGKTLENMAMTNAPATLYAK